MKGEVHASPFLYILLEMMGNSMHIMHSTLTGEYTP